MQQLSGFELQGYLGKGGKVLAALGYSHIPDDHNPVWQALSGLAPWTMEELRPAIDAGELTDAEAARLMTAGEQNAIAANKLRSLIWKGKSPNKSAILRAYVVCQTACLNKMNGPVATGQLATLRQRWYASANPQAMGFKFAAQALERYLIRSADVVLVDDDRSLERARQQGAKRVEFKVNWNKAKSKVIAIEIAAERGITIPQAIKTLKVHKWPKSGWGRTYAQNHSQLLADLVRTGMTYENLWVKDASRDIKQFSPLFEDFYAVFLLEKQGLFEHFQPFCRNVGIPILIAMGGNNAFSGVEFVLNENFRDWYGSYKPTVENPLHIFVLSDHDYAGHVPVMAGAVAQFERYLPGMVECHRVGVTPEQVRQTGRSILETGYEFEADYNTAYQAWAEEEGVWVGNICYGIEVEALTPYSLYIPYLVKSIIEACGGDDELKKKLLEMAQPDWYRVQQLIDGHAFNMSNLIYRLNVISEWARGKAYDYQNSITRQTGSLLGYEGDEYSWRNLDEVQEQIVDTIQKQEIDLKKYAEHAQGDSYGAWKPVDDEATNKVAFEVFLAGWDSCDLDAWQEWKDEVDAGNTDESELWPFGREHELVSIVEGVDGNNVGLVNWLGLICRAMAKYGLRID